MKNLFRFLSLVIFVAIPPAVHAQTTVTYVGSSVGGTLPGSANDFFFPYGGDYSFTDQTANDHVTGPNGSVFANLNDFTLNGGVSGGNVVQGYAFSTINSPEGQSVLTGDLNASPGIAFAITPTPNSATADPSFNYNNFNIYIAISTTGGFYNDSVVSIDPRDTTQIPAFGTNDVAVKDNTTDSNDATYLEFNVQGLGTTMASNPGADLVVSANLPNSDGSVGYIGAISFQSVPEPSSYSMLFGSLAFLLLAGRRIVQA